jgi:hypothetical protein
MKRHQRSESLDLIGLQREEDILTGDGVVEFRGNVGMPGSQPRCQELSAHDTAVKDDVNRWRLTCGGESPDAVRPDRPIACGVLSLNLCIRRHECSL